MQDLQRRVPLVSRKVHGTCRKPGASLPRNTYAKPAGLTDPQKRLAGVQFGGNQEYDTEVPRGTECYEWGARACLWHYDRVTHPIGNPCFMVKCDTCQYPKRVQSTDQATIAFT